MSHIDGGVLVIWIIRIGGILLVALFLGIPYLPRNRFSGIRFCYTLADDDVWRKVHTRFRWVFLILGLMCFYPFSGVRDLMIFTAVFMIFMAGAAVSSYRQAKRLYLDKYGTTDVVCRGLFKYGPPSDAVAESSEED